MRTTFDAVADEYDRVRPRYPEEIFDDLVELAGLSPGARLLEIGSGTGQATLPLTRRGFDVLAVEPGSRLAASTRRLGVAVVNATFEDWDPEGATFDGVVSFAAFHWVDPDVRYEKAARILRPGGALAIFDWEDALEPGGDEFFIAVVDDFAAIVPEWEVTAPLPSAVIEDRVSRFIDASGYFAPAEARRYGWSVTYGADDYVAFLATQSSYLVLDASRRERLLARIHRRIVEQGGSVEKQFFGLLAVALTLEV